MQITLVASPRNHHERMAWARKAGLNHWRKWCPRAGGTSTELHLEAVGSPCTSSSSVRIAFSSVRCRWTTAVGASGMLKLLSNEMSAAGAER